MLPPRSEAPILHLVGVQFLKGAVHIINDRLRQILEDQRIVLTFEMDDFVLSPLEELAFYEEKGLLEFDYVYDLFAEYIDVFMSNAEVRKYIHWMRETTRIDVYRKLENLQRKIKLRAGRSMNDQA